MKESMGNYKLPSRMGGNTCNPFIWQRLISKMYTAFIKYHNRGWSHITVGMTLAFHMAHPDSIPGTLYGSPSSSGVIPVLGVRSEPWTQPGVTLKPSHKTNLSNSQKTQQKWGTEQTLIQRSHTSKGLVDM